MLSIVAPPLASRRPVNVAVPVTIKLSSMVVVPPAESIVRLPVEVSISLSPAIPILMLSISAPPLASRRPVRVLVPVTIKLSLIVVIPLKESITKPPDLVSIVFNDVAPIRIFAMCA